MQGNGFGLGDSTRKTLSFLLIIHPVATALGLVCLILALCAHLHAPSHSPRYLLGLFMLTIPTMLASLLAFIIDILLFIPHMRFGGWLVLAATIILFISSVITCFMRRTLVSRKARRQRIADNAEMNGQNYYESRQAEMAGANSLPRAESPPPLSGESTIPLSSEKGIGFASYEARGGSEDRGMIDSGGLSQSSGSLTGTYGAGRRVMAPPRRDQYGNPLPQDDMSLAKQQSNTSLRSTPSNRSGNGPPMMPNGRGGYGPGGRGGYGPRGGMRSGPPPGMRGPPPPGYGGRGRGGPNGMMMGRGGPPQNGYGRNDQSYNGPPQLQQQYSGPPRLAAPSMPMGEPLMIGQAVEMDAHHGLPSPSTSRPGSARANPEMEINQLPGIMSAMAPPRAMSPSSDYSGHVGMMSPPEQYVPPRAQWGQPNPHPNASRTPTNDPRRALSPIVGSPTNMRAPGRGYVEDVDPAFAAPSKGLPASLMAAGGRGSPAQTQYRQTQSSTSLPDPNYQRGPVNGHNGQQLGAYHNPTESTLDSNNASLQYARSYDSLGDEQKSPAMSETSNFTSISQRGVNPAWRPPPPTQPMPQRPDQQRMMLNANPDFAVGPRRGGGQMGGQQRGGMQMGGQQQRGQPVGRYPGAF